MTYEFRILKMYNITTELINAIPLNVLHSANELMRESASSKT